MEKEKGKSKWPPAHSTSTGYPWDGVRSEAMYKNRFTDHNKVLINETISDHYVVIDGNIYDSKDYPVKELACNLLDAEAALVCAEEQIRDMLAEAPFVPEEFGFVNVVPAEGDVTVIAIRVYVSALCPEYSLHRIAGTDYGWKLLKKRSDSTFDEVEVYLPCHRIAYALFVALGVDVERGEEYKFSLPQGEGIFAKMKVLEEVPIVDHNFNRLSYPGTDGKAGE